MNRLRVGVLALYPLIAAIGVPFAVRAQDNLPTAPPLSETRLSVHTLLREDVFAGFLSNDMKRFARGEKNIDLLLEKRPDQKANLLAWKGGTVLYRAVLAHESRRNEEFERKYRQALDLLSQASTLKTGNDGVPAITAGSFVILADRLPESKRAAAWGQTYVAYQNLWKQQGPDFESFPAHFKGEVLGGLALSAARTGHLPESDQYLDKMLVSLRDTPYGAAAKQWKESPKTASKSGLACLSCHESGRLAPRMSALSKSVSALSKP